MPERADQGADHDRDQTGTCSGAPDRQGWWALPVIGLASRWAAGVITVAALLVGLLARR